MSNEELENEQEKQNLANLRQFDYMSERMQQIQNQLKQEQATFSNQLTDYLADQIQDTIKTCNHTINMKIS